MQQIDRPYQLSDLPLQTHGKVSLTPEHTGQRYTRIIAITNMAILYTYGITVPAVLCDTSRKHHHHVLLCIPVQAVGMQEGQGLVCPACQGKVKEVEDPEGR